jgi:hypothetical protein
MCIEMLQKLVLQLQPKILKLGFMAFFIMRFLLAMLITSGLKKMLSQCFLII